MLNKKNCSPKHISDKRDTGKINKIKIWKI